MTFPQSDPAMPQSGSPHGQPHQPYQQPHQPYQQTGPAYQQPGAAYPPQGPAYPPQGPAYPQQSPAYPPQPYGAPPGYAYPYPTYNPAAQTNTMAILALVFAFVFAPVAIVLGHMARKQIQERGEGGAGLALAGLILGYVFTGFMVLSCGLFIVEIVVAMNTVNSTGTT